MRVTHRLANLSHVLGRAQQLRVARVVCSRRSSSTADAPSLVLGPHAAHETAGAVGLTRGQRSNSEIFASSVLGGTLLSFGAAAFATVAAGSPALAASAPGLHKLASALIFPSGLAMIVFTGTDLLTSNFVFHLMPFRTHPTRNVSLKTTFRVWLVSFAGNAVGCVAMAAACAHVVFVGQPLVAAWAATLACGKVGGRCLGHQRCTSIVSSSWCRCRLPSLP
jgi:formate/nitrite transporter FocA (FNT family)